MLQVLQDDGRKASFELRMFECALNFSLEMLQREFKNRAFRSKILIRLRKPFLMNILKCSSTQKAP